MFQKETKLYQFISFSSKPNGYLVHFQIAVMKCSKFTFAIARTQSRLSTLFALFTLVVQKKLVARKTNRRSTDSGTDHQGAVFQNFLTLLYLPSRHQVPKTKFETDFLTCQKTIQKTALTFPKLDFLQFYKCETPSHVFCCVIILKTNRLLFRPATLNRTHRSQSF